MSPTVQPEPATAPLAPENTGVGSVFVSNYPPFSFWNGEAVPRYLEALDEAPGSPEAGAPLGLYLHIPFCRKRCKFCYFRVYTDKNAGAIGGYLEAAVREAEMYAERPAVAGRRLKFVYFGGGTPSYLSAAQLERLVAGLRGAISWDGAEEFTFECEPGTLSRAKLETIREIGVTRLSLGVENFNDEILRENGRAHLSEEIYRVLPWIAEVGFPQLNIDLIAGMVGETWETWRETVARTLEVAPDSVTVYQMELPFNTEFSKRLLGGGLERPVADWETKRAWHEYAFEELAAAGYGRSSAYTMVRGGGERGGGRFVYRDSVWHGADMVGLGVSSFGHMGGVHGQNTAGWGEYLERIGAGELPLSRAFVTSERERLTREMILQLKLGELDAGYFRRKFGADILEAFGDAFEELRGAGMLAAGEGRVELTRRGLLRVDQLLPAFYEARYRGARYT